MTATLEMQILFVSVAACQGMRSGIQSLVNLDFALDTSVPGLQVNWRRRSF